MYFFQAYYEFGDVLVSNIGYIYILSNSAFKKNLFKIGRTSRDAESRANEIYLGATGVPTPFIVEFTFPVSDSILAEESIHSSLDFYRFSPKREFFEIDLLEAKNQIEKVCNDINSSSLISPPKALDNEDWIVISNEADTDFKKVALKNTNENSLNLLKVTDDFNFKRVETGRETITKRKYFPKYDTSQRVGGTIILLGGGVGNIFLIFREGINGNITDLSLSEFIYVMFFLLLMGFAPIFLFIKLILYDILKIEK